MRTLLETRLFLAKPDFLYALSDFHSKLTDLKATKMLEVQQSPMLLPDFMAEQGDLRRCGCRRLWACGVRGVADPDI